MTQILLIRHAEKPTPDAVVNGVDETGKTDRDELSVLGWQRAGALAALLCEEGAKRRMDLQQPRHLFAARPTSDKPSARSVRTLQPLADVLGLPISLEFAAGQESEVAKALRALDGCALVAWQHQGLVKIAAALCPSGDRGPPDHWPADRYDLIWALEGEPDTWRFRQVPQLLLAGDCDSPIEP